MQSLGISAGDEDAYTTGGLDFQPDAVKAESLNEPAPVTPGMPLPCSAFVAFVAFVAYSHIAFTSIPL